MAYFEGRHSFALLVKIWLNPITVGNFALTAFLFELHAGGSDLRLYDGSNLKTYL